MVDLEIWKWDAFIFGNLELMGVLYGENVDGLRVWFVGI